MKAGTAIAAALLLLASAFPPDRPAVAGDVEGIDCGSTNFRLDVPDFTFECYEYGSSSLMVEGEVAAVRRREFYAYSADNRTFIDVVENEVRGSFYIERRDLETDIAGYFKVIKAANWGPGAETSGFETRAFTGAIPDGREMDCVGFRRGVTRRGRGFARLVIGFACSSDGRDHAYAVLSRLQAPGD